MTPEQVKKALAQIDEPELLDKQLAESKSYGSSFRLLALRICHEYKGDMAKASMLTGVPERTLLEWVALWNGVEVLP